MIEDIDLNFEESYEIIEHDEWHEIESNSPNTEEDLRLAQLESIVLCTRLK